MFFQRDYVLRMIEMWGELVRRILSLTNEAARTAELNDVARRACGMPLSMLLMGEPRELSEILEDAQRYLAGQLLLLSAESKADHHGEEELGGTRGQALMILASLEDQDYIEAAASPVADVVRQFLSTLPEDALAAAGLLLERAGRFADAEDALAAAEDEDVLQAFYQRMRALPEAELVKGGLTREEVSL